jgi:hypothetical protein
MNIPTQADIIVAMGTWDGERHVGIVDDTPDTIPDDGLILDVTSLPGVEKGHIIQLEGYPDKPTPCVCVEIVFPLTPRGRQLVRVLSIETVAREVEAEELYDLAQKHRQGLH